MAEVALFMAPRLGADTSSFNVTLKSGNCYFHNLIAHQRSICIYHVSVPSPKEFEKACGVVVPPLPDLFFFNFTGTLENYEVGSNPHFLRETPTHLIYMGPTIINTANDPTISADVGILIAYRFNGFGEPVNLQACLWLNGKVVKIFPPSQLIFPLGQFILPRSYLASLGPGGESQATLTLLVGLNSLFTFSDLCPSSEYGYSAGTLDMGPFPKITMTRSFPRVINPGIEFINVTGTMNMTFASPFPTQVVGGLGYLFYLPLLHGDINDRTNFAPLSLGNLILAESNYVDFTISDDRMSATVTYYPYALDLERYDLDFPYVLKPVFAFETANSFAKEFYEFIVPDEADNMNLTTVEIGHEVKDMTDPYTPFLEGYPQYLEFTGFVLKYASSYTGTMTRKPLIRLEFASGRKVVVNATLYDVHYFFIENILIINF